MATLEQALATRDDAALVMMDADAARDAIARMRRDLEQVDANLSSFRQHALDFRDREGWRALGYTSYLEAIQVELRSALSRSYLSRLIAAAEVERDLALPIGNTIPESQLRPLAAIDTPAGRQQAWNAAGALAGDDKLTAQHVQQAVDEQLEVLRCTRCRQQRTGLTQYDADTIAAYPAGALLCEACVVLVLSGAPEQVERACACGQRATSKRQIAGLLEWRCDDCTARAEQQAIDDEQQVALVYSEREAMRQQIADDLRALCEQVEQLGATISYTALADVARVQVVPPAGYQQTPLNCDASDLRMLVEKWSQQASSSAPASRPAHSAQQERATLLRLWKSIELALDEGYAAVALHNAREIVTILERKLA